MIGDRLEIGECYKVICHSFGFLFPNESECSFLPKNSTFLTLDYVGEKTTNIGTKFESHYLVYKVFINNEIALVSIVQDGVEIKQNVSLFVAHLEKIT